MNNPIRELRKSLGMTQAQCAGRVSTLRGRPFRQSDWSKQESRDLTDLKPKTRAYMYDAMQALKEAAE
jgi:transcriptional regulator with XRE-family HTH domain